MEFFKRFLDKLRGEDGQTVIEYVLVIVLIGVVLLLAFRTTDLENSISNASSEIASSIQSGVDGLGGGGGG
jgi:Flp pilus assembly pilin Flp